MIDRQIIKNISYIGMTNIAGIIIPLLILPFITRILGPEQFGQYAWAVSAGTLLGLICDFGFNWSAAREVALHKADRARTAAIIAEAYAIRALMIVASGALILALWLLLPRHEGGIAAVLPYVLLVALCNLLTPTWMFQGLEQFRLIAISSIIGRLSGIAAIFALVRGPEDAELAIMLTAAGAVLPGLISFRFIARHFGDVLQRPTGGAILARMQRDWRIFTADLVVQIYAAAQTFIVGLLGGPLAAAPFNIADRCLGAGKSAFAAVSQATMPRVASLAATDPSAGLRLICRIMPITGGIGLVGTLIMALAADEFVLLAFGPDFMEAARVMRILAPVPLLVGLCTCFSSLYMFNYGEDRLWSVMLKTAAAINFSTLLTLHLLGMETHIAAAIAIGATESFIFCVAGYRFLRAIQRQRLARNSP